MDNHYGSLHNSTQLLLSLFCSLTVTWLLMIASNSKQLLKGSRNNGILQLVIKKGRKRNANQSQNSPSGPMRPVTAELNSTTSSWISFASSMLHLDKRHTMRRSEQKNGMIRLDDSAAAQSIYCTCSNRAKLHERHKWAKKSDFTHFIRATTETGISEETENCCLT